jgi:hypothetical protein
MNTENKNNRNLSYLNELSDYKVSDSDKDVRSWNVKDAEGKIIGKIDDLLISKKDNRVVYLNMEVDKSLIDDNYKPYARSNYAGSEDYTNKEGEDHLIIPIGMVNLDIDDEIVHTPKLSGRTFAETKRIGRGSVIDRRYETSVLESYNRDNDLEFSSEERQDHDTKLYQRTEYKSRHQGEQEEL